MRSLRSGMDSGDTLSGGTEQDLQPEVQGGYDSSARQGATISAKPARGSSLRGVRKAERDAAGVGSESQTSDVLSTLQRHPSRQGMGEARSQGFGGTQDMQGREGSEECCVEGRGDISAAPRELRERSLRALPAGTHGDGAQGRVCDGAPPCDGAMDQAATSEDRGCASQGPSTVDELAGQFGTLAGQSESQTGGAWPICGRCGKPIVPDGLGTALKPATEPICLARKPLDGTVAANVLEHGTGAINIDGCRIEGGEGGNRGGEESSERRYTDHGATNFAATPGPRGGDSKGRWPANIIHDGSDEVVASFPDSDGQLFAVGPKHGDRGSVNCYGDYGPRPETPPRGDSGSAARFFYSAKAGPDDRLGSKHPTVKPVALMRHLVKLVTPPGGLVLDPFAGTGSTGIGAMAEGFRAILIEREGRFVEDIKIRVAHASGGGAHSGNLKTRSKTAAETSGPLFERDSDYEVAG